MEDKSAKEMFEEQGYKLEKTPNIVWRKEEIDDSFYSYKKVVFDLYNKTFYSEANFESDGIDMQLNKAIQKQIEELGW